MLGGDKQLKESFLRLYSVSVSKEKVVNEMGKWISNENRKYFRWMLSWFVWEQGLKQQLVSEISIVQWNKVTLDAWCWMGEDTNVYTAHSSYMALLEEDENPYVERCGEVWDLRMPGSGKGFGWRF